jgi:hypothetical protein
MNNSKELRKAAQNGSSTHTRTGTENPGSCQRRSYRSAEEALNAALAVVETAAAPDFDGTQDELEALLLDGLDSGGPIQADDTFWSRLRAETGRIAAEHQRARKSVVDSRDFSAR